MKNRFILLALCVVFVAALLVTIAPAAIAALVGAGSGDTPIAGVYLYSISEANGVYSANERAGPTIITTLESVQNFTLSLSGEGTIASFGTTGNKIFVLRTSAFNEASPVLVASRASPSTARSVLFGDTTVSFGANQLNAGVARDGPSFGTASLTTADKSAWSPQAAGGHESVLDRPIASQLFAIAISLRTNINT